MLEGEEDIEKLVSRQQEVTFVHVSVSLAEEMNYYFSTSWLLNFINEEGIQAFKVYKSWSLPRWASAKRNIRETSLPIAASSIDDKNEAT